MNAPHNQFADRIAYEWIVETIDANSGDILDTCAWNTARDALLFISQRPYVRNEHFDMALTRSVITFDRGLTDRAYAYVDADGLPDKFDDGHAVPRRFMFAFNDARADYPLARVHA